MQDSTSEESSELEHLYLLGIFLAMRFGFKPLNVVSEKHFALFFFRFA
jgi:hypothetical protein